MEADARIIYECNKGGRMVYKNNGIVKEKTVWASVWMLLAFGLMLIYVRLSVYLD